MSSPEVLDSAVGDESGLGFVHHARRARVEADDDGVARVETSPRRAS